MSEIFAGFDILGLATLIGAILFLGGLLLVLWDNRSFDEVNRRHAAAAERGTREPKGGDESSPGSDDGSPGRPSRPKRAA